MKIAVVGAGGLGGVFAARLAAAGREVHVLARGAHLEAIREHGLSVEGGPENVNARFAGATDRVEEIGPADVVLLCVKLWDVGGAAEAIRPLIGPDTAVIPLQNGVDAGDLVAAVLGPEPVVDGVAFVEASMSGPGRIMQHSPFNNILVGERSGTISARCLAFARACVGSRVGIGATSEIRLEAWRKFVFLVAANSVGGVVRGDIGAVRRDPENLALFRRCAEETVAVGRASGVALEPETARTSAALLTGLPDSWVAPMTRDILNGDRLELPWFSGRVVELGRELGVATPTLDALHADLLPRRDGA